MILKGKQNIIEYLGVDLQNELTNNKYKIDFLIHPSIGDYMDAGRNTQQGLIANRINGVVYSTGNGNFAPLKEITSYVESFIFLCEVRQEDSAKVKEILNNYANNRINITRTIDDKKIIITALTPSDNEASDGSPNGGTIQYAMQINVSVVKGALIFDDMTYQIKTTDSEGTELDYVDMDALNVTFNLGLTNSSSLVSLDNTAKSSPSTPSVVISTELYLANNPVAKRIAENILNGNTYTLYTIKVSLDTTEKEYYCVIGGDVCNIKREGGKVLSMVVTFEEVNAQIKAAMEA